MNFWKGVMNKRGIKEFFLGIFVLSILIGAIVLVYRYEKSKAHRDLAKRISELSPRGGPPETIDGLRIAIAAYEAQIELNVKEGAQTGSYWKILAVRLADKGMHRDAIAALERALYYHTSDPTLFYLTGDSASIIAANALQFSINSRSERDFYYSLAESAYLKAIGLDGAYAKPLLGLGILYTFDLERPAEAIPHLLRYLDIFSNDLKALFVLARAYYMTESYGKAVELYDRIIGRTKDPNVKAEAQNNKEFIMELMHG
jgi:tetratricopeptide (TPR) repeat protein